MNIDALIEACETATTAEEAAVAAKAAWLASEVLSVGVPKRDVIRRAKLVLRLNRAGCNVITRLGASA